MEFLGVIESIREEEASLKRIFGGEGKAANRGAQTEKYLANLAEAADLYASVLSGRRPAYYLKEAMTTSDFPVLFGDILDRQILAEFQEYEPTWPQFVNRRTVNDFRPVQYRDFPPGASGRLERVREQEEYPERSLPDEARISYAVTKRGARIPFSWETLVNDDIDYFRSIPQRFGKAARRTEQYEAVELFVASTGPVSPFFSVGNNNLLSGAGSALSISSLQTALARFRDLTDEDGEPIVVDAAILVVPPALEMTAMNILNATEIRLTGAAIGEGELGTAGDATVVTGNWLRNRLRLVVDPYISLVNSTNGDTAWYVFAEPNAGRPALQMAFLRGHETPRVFIKEPNARPVGGGTANPEDGDFDTDSIEYKVRHVLGGSRIEPKAAVASLGQ